MRAVDLNRGDAEALKGEHLQKIAKSAKGWGLTRRRKDAMVGRDRDKKDERDFGAPIH
jgi:hypothetical protein